MVDACTSPSRPAGASTAPVPATPATAAKAGRKRSGPASASSTPQQPSGPGATTKWTEEVHLVLISELVNIATEGGTVSLSKHKESLESALAARGFHFTWEAIRPTSKMARWEDIREDLFEIILQVFGTIEKDKQAQIVEKMKARGHDMNWNAIRYVLFLKRQRHLAGRELPDGHYTVTMSRVNRRLHHWDADTHVDVLIAVLEHMKPTAKDFTSIMEALREKGYTFTEGALMYVDIL
ncbi:hypothetical protein VTJ49DRAFT_7096 [Mycothermus thermophilus]|uniref:Uncharacterized protein n=1 Tax=Humicola insolens TaxID=85995 RepID=A0ABR3VHQ4_HUMIN